MPIVVPLALPIVESNPLMSIRKLLLLLPLVVAFQSPSRAIDIYVNNQLGNDQLPGTSAEPRQGDGPVETISRGLRIAGRSDRLIIANTGIPYNEMISLSGPHHSGSVERPFTIVGNGAVIDGTILAAPEAWSHVADSTFAMPPRRLTYQHLFLDGKPLPRSDASQALDLQPLQWALADGKIYFATQDNRVPESYDLRHCGLQTGITLYNTRHVQIENLVIQGFQQDGINAHELASRCDLIDVECRANGRSGLSVGGVSHVRVIRGNFYDNGRVQVRTEGLAKLELYQCDVAEGSSPPYSAEGKSLLVDGQLITTP